MRNYALVGASCTGKTTTLNELKAARPSWLFIDEFARELPLRLGFESPWHLASKHGNHFAQGLLMMHWSLLTSPHSKLLVDRQVLVCDRSPIDTLAYFLLSETKDERAYQEPMRLLAKYFAAQIEHFFVFPMGVIQFKHDAVRLVDDQLPVQPIIIDLLDEFDCKYSFIRTLSIEDRTAEITTAIESFHHERLSAE